MQHDALNTVPEHKFATRAASVTSLPPIGRLSLRLREHSREAIGTALGLSLPGRIGEKTRREGLEALRLGPDEYLLHLPESGVAALAAALAGVYDAHPHSLTDISAREKTLLIEGPRAAELLTLGLARDVDSLPPGEGRRTVFDGVTVILHRDAGNRFRIDVWNSFTAFLADFLARGCRELTAEPA